MQNQKTIFITSFFGFISRNILATDTLKILRQQPNLKIVILAPENKQKKYEESFGGENVIIEGIKIEKPTKIERIFSVLFHNLSDTIAWRIHRLIGIKRDKRYFSAPFYWILSKLGHFKIVRQLARWADYVFMPKNRYKKYFDKYKPEMVFATDLFQSNDIDVMREARSRGIFVLGMVRSWDNITTKGLNQIIPDQLIVNTEKIKEEAVRYNDVNPKNIHIVGIPHYDRYVVESRTSRDKLFNELRLNPSKKTIFFAPPSDIYSEGNPITKKVIKVLSTLDAQLLIRLYLVGNIDLGDIKPMLDKIAIDAPESAGDFMQADLTSGDAHLADLLYNSDVVIAFASTLAIDAAAFNKPIVFIGFDGDERPYWRGLRRYYDYDHQRLLLETGGVKLAKNMEELITYTKQYLNNPKLDEEGRKKMIQERCWKLDGKSGERLAKTILQYLK